MRVCIGAFCWVVLSTCWVASAQPGDLSWYLWKGDKAVPFGGLVDEIRAVKIVAPQDSTDRRIVYGDRQGVLHAVRFAEGRFQEEWSGQFHTSAVSEVFVADIDADGQLEIVAYSQKGHIAFYSADGYRTIWQTRKDEYRSISAMAVMNVDDDAQLELLFVGEKVDENTKKLISRLFVYDCLNLLEERRSEQDLVAQGLVVADFDRDGEMEIALNTGPVVDMHSLRVEWHFGGCDRIGYVDVNNDGIPDLIGERKSLTPERFLKVFDIRQNYRAVHSADARDRLVNCAVCHGVVTYCAPCHAGRGVTITESFHRRDRKQEGASHDVDPAGRVRECATCHRSELEGLCLECHQKALLSVDDEEKERKIWRGRDEILQVLQPLRGR